MNTPNQEKGNSAKAWNRPLYSVARMKIFTSLFVIGLLCGCTHRHFVAGHGDVGQFILQTAIQFGGTPVTTNNLPPISDQWSYLEDKGGVIINLTHQELPAVESFLHQSFGQPAGGNAGKDGYYQLTTNGASIYFTDVNHATQVIILRSY
jgi:hypothetical protein